MVVLDFGYTKDPNVSSSIHDLGDQVLRLNRNNFYTVLAQSETYNYLRKIAPALVDSGQLYRIDVAQSGDSNGSGLEDGGSYFVLKRAKEMIEQMDDSGLGIINVVVFAHKLHTPRVIQQANLLGFNTPVSGGDWCPTKLYPDAAQWWCRNALLWHLRELVGRPLLRKAGQL